VPAIWLSQCRLHCQALRRLLRRIPSVQGDPGYCRPLSGGEESDYLRMDKASRLEMSTVQIGPVFRVINIVLISTPIRLNESVTMRAFCASTFKSTFQARVCCSDRRPTACAAAVARTVPRNSIYIICIVIYILYIYYYILYIYYYILYIYYYILYIYYYI
jgi:hypothetical protein